MQLSLPCFPTQKHCAPQVCLLQAFTFCPSQGLSACSSYGGGTQQTCTVVADVGQLSGFAQVLALCPANDLGIKNISEQSCSVSGRVWGEGLPNSLAWKMLSLVHVGILPASALQPPSWGGELGL